MNIPNYLTFLRIGLIPVFVLVFYLPFHWSRLATAVIFTLAALTDWLDGYLARKWQQTSQLGTFLDPVADKLIVAVGGIDLLTGAFPARYGGRLSSVLDVRSAEEPRPGMHASADVSVLAATGRMAGSFGGDRGT